MPPVAAVTPSPDMSLRHYTEQAVARSGPPLPSRMIPNVLPARRPLSDYGASEARRADLLQRAVELLAQLSPDDPEAVDLPELVIHYHSLMPRDAVHTHRSRTESRVFPVQTRAFKAISARDGRYYLLRKLEGVRSLSDAAMQTVVGAWQRVQHPSIVPLREIFGAKFGAAGPSVLVAFDYVPGAATLVRQAGVSTAAGLLTRAASGCRGPQAERYLGRAAQPVDERMLWAITAQLLSVMRAVHGAGMACRVIDVSKVLVVGESMRVLLNGVGIVDALEFDQPTHKHLPQLQYEDLYSLGKLLLSLCCGNTNVLNAITNSVEYVGKHYSAALKSFLVYLLSNPTPTAFPTLDEAVRLTAPQLLDFQDAVCAEAQSLEDDLSRELDNGRLLRLLLKLGFINERPEFDLDSSWSETGDRYPLKLFRDYVFHQVDADGAPVLDLGHVYGALNRLDAGDEHDRCTLVSRDGQTALVVSFADLRRALEHAYADLEQRATEGGGTA